MIDGKTKLICLIGQDVTKSLSPNIHNYIYDKYNLNYSYMNFSLEEKDLESFVNSVKVLDIKGFNVTIPYKEKIIEFLDEIDESAKDIKAVNTVKNIDGKLIGYNTDGAGYVLSLETNKVNIEHKNILIIGAGGAARGILYEICKYKPNSIHIKNRTQSKSEILIDEVRNIYKKIDFGNFDENIDYDLIINTTSIGMKDETKTPFELDKIKNSVISDIVYIPRETKFLKDGKSKNFKTIEGIEMLICQGIIADQIWLDTEFDTKSLLDEIKNMIFEK